MVSTGGREVLLILIVRLRSSFLRVVVFHGVPHPHLALFIQVDFGYDISSPMGWNY